MASYYGENIYTNGNNIQYTYILYPILSNTNNANNYNVNTINQIQNYQVQANQYKTISYPFLTENFNKTIINNPQTIYKINTNIVNANNNQYMQTIPAQKHYQITTIRYPNNPTTLNLYNFKNNIQKVPTIEIYKEINKNNLQKYNTLSQDNHVQRVNTTTEKQNNNLSYKKQPQTLIKRKEPNYNQYIINTEKINSKRNDNIYINDYIQTSPNIRLTKNNIKNNLYNIGSPAIYGDELLDTAKVIKIEDNLTKEINQKNQANYKIYKYNNNNIQNGNQRYTNNTQYNNIQNIKEEFVFDDSELIDNININDRNNSSFVFQSAYNLKNIFDLNNNFLDNENIKNNSMIQENSDSYFNSQLIDQNNNNNKKNNIIQVGNQINYDVDQSIDNNIYLINNNLTRTNPNNTQLEQKVFLYNPDNDSKIEPPFFSINNELINNNKCRKYIRQTNSAPVKGYSYYENQGLRKYMEDKGKVIENLNGDPNKILFGLFDGHGGDQVSKYLQDNLSNYMKKIINYSDIKIGFKECFNKIDEDIKALNCPSVGSTCTIVYIEKKNNKRILYCANIGDTRCILIKKNNYMRLSYDHRVSDYNEKNRIISGGGVIFNGRVYGILNLSRSFGDFMTKDYGVIVEPHFVKYEITQDDLFCVIASDGIWDVMGDLEIRNIIPYTGSMTENLSKKIVNEAMRRRSKDNLSCFVILLN